MANYVIIDSVFWLSMFAAHDDISVDVVVNNKLYSALGGWGKDSGCVEG